MKRFWTKVNKTSNCWNWTGAVIQNGYGQFFFGGKVVGAHRASYEINVAQIPEGMEIDHLCRNRKCVNPEHLEVVTRQVNQLRSNSVSGINARKTHCVRGHEYTSENTYLEKKGKSCRTCRNKANSRYYAAKKVLV